MKDGYKTRQCNSILHFYSFVKYKNQPTLGEYICYAEVAQTFRFEDKLPRIEWQIQDESKNILGYACQKAIGKLYNREWTVWFTLDIPMVKGSSALLCFREDIVSAVEPSNCIRCGRCVEVCPGRVMPNQLATLAEHGDIDGFLKYDGMECCECGCCSFVCPAKRPVAQTMAEAKDFVRKAAK